MFYAGQANTSCIIIFIWKPIHLKHTVKMRFFSEMKLKFYSLAFFMRPYPQNPGGTHPNQIYGIGRYF